VIGHCNASAVVCVRALGSPAQLWGCRNRYGRIEAGLARVATRVCPRAHDGCFTSSLKAAAGFLEGSPPGGLCSGAAGCLCVLAQHAGLVVEGVLPECRNAGVAALSCRSG